MIKIQELRIGNCVTINNPDSWIELLNIPMIVTGIDFSMTKKEKEIWANSNGKIRVENGYNTYSQFSQFIDPIPLTEENFLKHIDWVFEERFNIKRKSNEFWEETCYLMENIIDGSGDFEVCFSKSKVMPDIEVSYWIDNKRLEFMLSDTLHNFQNLFFTTTGQELPLKKQ